MKGTGMLKPKFDNRLYPAIAILSLGSLQLFASIVFGFYLNLDHQAKGFEFADPDFVKAPHVSWFWDHSQAYCLSFVVDMLMGGAELFSVGFSLLIALWMATKDDFDHFKISNDDPVRRKLQRKIDMVTTFQERSKYIFYVAGGISVVMVCTAFVKDADLAWSNALQILLKLAVGCSTPFLIAGASYIFLIGVQTVISLLFDKDSYDPLALQKEQEKQTEVEEETLPADDKANKPEAAPKPVPATTQKNGSGSGQGGKHGGSKKPPRQQPVEERVTQ
jgi:hypothetical protein